jgi:hypothetical protein
MKPDELNNQVENDVKLGFFMVKNSVIEQYDLTIGAFWLYACLCKYSFGKSTCFPSIKTLSKLARAGLTKKGVTKQAIRNWTEELISKKLITVSDREGNGLLYTILEVAETVTGQPGLTGQPQLQNDNQGCQTATRVDPKNKNLRRRKEEENTYTPPSADEVKSYMEELGFSDPESWSERFVDHCAGNLIMSSFFRESG